MSAQIKEQQQEIDILNSGLPPYRRFKLMECPNCKEVCAYQMPSLSSNCVYVCDYCQFEF